MSWYKVGFAKWFALMALIVIKWNAFPLIHIIYAEKVVVNVASPPCPVVSLIRLKCIADSCYLHVLGSSVFLGGLIASVC